jgi:hypothetical protein
MVFCIRDQYGNTPLNVPENALPVATSSQRKSTEYVAQQFSPVANELPVNPVSVSPGGPYRRVRVQSTGMLTKTDNYL